VSSINNQSLIMLKVVLIVCAQCSAIDWAAPDEQYSTVNDHCFRPVLARWMFSDLWRRELEI
jgi:hypothetical protein